MKRPDQAGEPGRKPDHGIVPSELRSLFPHLADVLVSSSYDDGSPKGAGSLFLEPLQGRWRGRLKVQGSGLMLVIHAADPESLLVAIEAALASGDAPWEDDPFGGVGGKKRKK